MAYSRIDSCNVLIGRRYPVYRKYVSVHGILFRNAAEQAARWLRVIDEAIRLLQAHTAAFPYGQDDARLLKYCEWLRKYVLIFRLHRIMTCNVLCKRESKDTDFVPQALVKE
jgi:hypothetical protein